MAAWIAAFSVRHTAERNRPKAIPAQNERGNESHLYKTANISSNSRGSPHSDYMGLLLGIVHPHRLHGTSIRARTYTDYMELPLGLGQPHRLHGTSLGLVHPYRLHGTSIRARTSTQTAWDFY